MGGGLGVFMDGRDMPKPMLPLMFIQEQRVFYMLASTLGNPAVDEESHVQVPPTNRLIYICNQLDVEIAACG